MIKNLNLKLVILFEYQDIKNVFLKTIFHIGLEKLLLLQNIKILSLIPDLKGKEIVGTFYEKEWQKINQKEFRVEKVIK